MNLFRYSGLCRNIFFVALFFLLSMSLSATSSADLCPSDTFSHIKGSLDIYNNTSQPVEVTVGGNQFTLDCNTYETLELPRGTYDVHYKNYWDDRYYGCETIWLDLVTPYARVDINF